MVAQGAMRAAYHDALARVKQAESKKGKAFALPPIQVCLVVFIVLLLFLFIVLIMALNNAFTVPTIKNIKNQLVIKILGVWSELYVSSRYGLSSLSVTKTP